MFGRGTNTAIDLVDNLIHNNIMPGEKLMEAAGVNEPEVLGAMAINEMGKLEFSGATVLTQLMNRYRELHGKCLMLRS